MKLRFALLALAFAAAPGVARAQGHDMSGMHDMSSMHDMNASKDATPSQPGQAAFGAISEIVRILKADPKTDWSRVDIEALRQHLIDMDDVVLHAAVAQRNVTGGAEMDVTGTGRTVDAIKRMATNHAGMLDAEGEYKATSRDLPNGVRITVTAPNASDAATVARIRGLGFAGLLTEGEHHAPHHLAIARGENPHGH